MEDLKVQWEIISSKSQNLANFCSISINSIQGSGSEICLYLEIPILNPEAAKDCSKINLALLSAYKRAMSISGKETAFENGLHLTNEELSKLLTQGSKYTNKITSVIFVKSGDTAYSSTCGKAFIWLIRQGKLIDITEKNQLAHPLKIFENYSSGKLLKDDLVVISSQNLFKYFPATNLYSRLQADPSNISWIKEEIKLLEKTENLNFALAIGTVTTNVIKSARMLKFDEVKLPDQRDQQIKQVSNFKLKAIAEYNSLTKDLKGYLSSIPDRIQDFKNRPKPQKQNTDQTKKPTVKSVLVEKKNTKIIKIVSIISVAIILISIYIYLSKQATKSEDQTRLKLDTLTLRFIALAMNPLVTPAQKIEARLIEEGLIKLSESEETKADADNLKSRLDKLTLSSDKREQVEVDTLAEFTSAENLIKLPFEIGVVENKKLKKISKLSNRILEEKEAEFDYSIESSGYLLSGKIVAYDGQNLTTIDTQTGKTASTYTGGVPAAHEYGGLSVYKDRIYLINRDSQTLSVFPVNNTGLIDKPVELANNTLLKKCLDISYDGTLTCLTQDTLLINTLSSNPKKIDLTNLYEPFGGTGKVSIGPKNIYILDRSNERIIIFDKDLKLKATFSFESGGQPIDFEVDEKAGSIYILSPKKLLKLKFDNK